MMKNSILLLLAVLLFSCGKEPEVDDSMIDGDVIFDASIANPENYILSHKISSPTAEQLAIPVIIACHGYSASTFEWQEMADWIVAENKNILFSQVLLGGHGRNYEEFKNSTWQVWQSSIVNEYEALVALGYTNISIVGSSTGCPLILELMSNNTFAANELNSVFLVDPIVIPSDKTLSLAKVAGPALGFIDTKQDSIDDMYWYHYRPQETLQELEKIITIIRKSLQKGIYIPTGTNVVVYKSTSDDAADPASAVLIYQGMEPKEQLDVHMMDSKLHVFTRLALRRNIRQIDADNQVWCFEDIVETIE
ncbi:MAG: carboxylesterase [Glaciecola sp.]|jgi:carboxylesterase